MAFRRCVCRGGGRGRGHVFQGIAVLQARSELLDCITYQHLNEEIALFLSCGSYILQPILLFTYVDWFDFIEINRVERNYCSLYMFIESRELRY